MFFFDNISTNNSTYLSQGQYYSANFAAYFAY